MADRPSHKRVLAVLEKGHWLGTVHAQAPSATLHPAGTCLICDVVLSRTHCISQFETIPGFDG